MVVGLHEQKLISGMPDWEWQKQRLKQALA